MIIDILPSTKARMKILKEIYSNDNINVRSIIRKARVSPNLAVDYIRRLKKYGILKKVGEHTQYISFSFESKFSELFSFILENYRKEEMLEKYDKLVPFAKQIERAIDGIVVVFGSYSRLEADKQSDLDLWIISDRKNGNIKKELQEIFVTLPMEFSATIETQSEFLKKRKDAIHQNILKEGIVLCKEEDYFKILKKNKLN